MSKLKFAMAMLAAGGAAGAASEAGAATTVTFGAGYGPYDATQDITLVGSAAQFYYGYNSTDEKTYLGTYGSSLLYQPSTVGYDPVKGPYTIPSVGFAATPVKTADITVDSTTGLPTSFTPKDTGHIDLTFTANGVNYAGFADVSGGAQLEAITYDVASVPEPASWALMIGGFGLAGAALRRQRRQAALNA
jgi:hypothetical protein